MIFDKKTKREFLDGYFIYDGACGSKSDAYGFVMLEKNENRHRDRNPVPRTRFLFTRTSQPAGERFYAVTTEGFDFTTITFQMESGRGNFIAVDTTGSVFSVINDLEDKVDTDVPGSDFSISISKVVRTVNSAYAVGSALRVYKRDREDAWLNNLDTLPIPKDFAEDTSLNNYSLEDMSGFSEDDMYAVGEGGSAYHFDGNKWTSIAFPTKLKLATATCAGDGRVYVSDKTCSIWVGRNSTWEKIVEEDMSLSFFDSAWFDGRMWFTNDYGLWILEDDNLVLAKNARYKPVPEDVAILCGRLDVAPDNSRMLLCGQHGAAVYDGQNWEILFNCEPM